jgi:hypothetical protein
MNLRRRLRSWLSTVTWVLGGWLGSRRRAAVRSADVAQHDYRTQTRGMPLRMTEWLRDRLRPAWLRLRHDHTQDGDS